MGSTNRENDGKGYKNLCRLHKNIFAALVLLPLDIGTSVVVS